MKSCAISRRATVLGWKRWALAVCLVRAAGHHPCSVLLSGMPLGIVVVIIGVRCCHRCALLLLLLSSSSSSHRALSLSYCTRRHCRAVPSCCAPRRRCTLSLLSPCIIVVVIALSSSRHAPRHCALSLHCRAVVTPLDPPSSSPSVVITAPSPSSRCRASLPWCYRASFASLNRNHSYSPIPFLPLRA